MDHVIVVIMENKSYTQVRTQPYMASLIARGSELANYFAITHPSQPNYLILWSGSTQGVTNDVCPPANWVAPGYTTENFGHALEAAGKTWKSYAEDLPEPASTVCSQGLYLRRHCPWTYFANLNKYNERPYSDLAFDIHFQTLPDLAFVIPNNCDNTHNSGCGVSVGDTWLANNVPAMLDAVGPNGCVIVTWDEDDNSSGNHVECVWAGPRIKSNYQETTGYNHYDLGATISTALGITPFAGFGAQTTNLISNIWFEGDLAVPPGSARAVSLSAPAPNPSRGGVSARLWLPAAMPVAARIHDVSGRTVRTITDGTHDGAVDLYWDGLHDDGSPAGPGIYFLTVRAGAQTLERKAVVLR
ncbi:MAG: hypothetical protein HY076_04720 [Candidatus Eisenbacteria bacterium]|uniref:FlgD/Vpr Ig-like domain-containing protein n=1 Tax=Eiseniibacteriota bacterium TaxID=2212470 RepID=A0A9D6L805_UNCEI|nr:hypothetical protein [Candidatus Eisenbacteria bacterium]MBI3539554.1 hypothetical protein [Candidatus Eisenbacteria bacterium]